ncbi:hypothetical protein CK203_058326 [Vitis vinifera]|uniref:Uncharacterized protein n=1 Tax=Vitis vinifera TaxID=29760 RepID=A0A438GE41_VITVI|nr:hypothetical protein CK203_058326 [Vitis vinifera]
MCKPTLLSQKPLLATPLKASKQTTKNGRTHYRIPPDRHFARRSQTGTQGPGASCPFHHNRGHLYKRSFTGPYLRCLSHSEAQYVLAELHENMRKSFRRTVSGT